MIRAVIDTNVSVSGLLFRGIPRKVIDRGIAREFTWVMSPPLLEELERVLSYSKFELSSKEVEALTKPIFNTVEIVVPRKQINVITRCPADNRVLECALTGKSSVIVTGDHRDLIAIKSFQGIKILTPKDFLALL